MYPLQTMYTISQAAVRTGIPVPVLRAWERRYGIVEPARTPSGYRLYGDEAIERLRTMHRLVEAGWSPSAAAAAIEAGTAPETGDQPGLEPGHEPEIAPNLIDPFVAAAAAMDVVAVEEVLDDMFASGSFERIAERYLLPSLESLGEAWADGRVDVGGEHMASHAMLRRLAASYEAAGVAIEETGSILVGLPSGSRHELGALAFAVAARRARLPVLYLGPDLPAENWVATAIRSQARAAVIGAVTPADRKSARAVAAALREARPDLLIAFGGRYQPLERSAGSDAGADLATIRLPVRLGDSVRALVAALDGVTSIGWRPSALK